MTKPKTKRKSVPRKAGTVKPKALAPSSRRKKVTASNTTSVAPAKRPPPMMEPRTKTEACLALLARPEGATLEELQKLTGWLPHSVRGFLAGTVKKMPELVLTSDKAPGESRRYRVTRAPS